MEKLVENGKIYLDGTLAKYQKEAKLCREYEVIQNYEEMLGIKPRFVLSALFKGAFVKTNDGQIVHVDIMAICENCLMVAQFTDDICKDYLFFEDFRKTWALYPQELQEKVEKYKDCYLKLKMTVKATEIFDDTNKIIFLGKQEVIAILHPDQANDNKKVDDIKEKMFIDFFKSKNYSAPKEDMSKLVKFDDLVAIPKKSEPITYRI